MTEPCWPAFALALLTLGAPCPAAPPGSESAAAPLEPERFRAEGRLVCLAEEMARLHAAQVPPVHDHVWGLRVEPDAKPGSKPGSPRYYLVLRTPQSEALFVDERFRKHVLVLTGRVFPQCTLIELSGFEWIHDGARWEVYYWCEVCAIRGVDPGACACCQGSVVLRERRIEDAPERPGTSEAGAGEAGTSQGSGASARSDGGVRAEADADAVAEAEADADAVAEAVAAAAAAAAAHTSPSASRGHGIGAEGGTVAGAGVERAAADALWCARGDSREWKPTQATGDERP